MVYITVKRNSFVAFLHDATVHTPISELQSTLCNIYNATERLKRLADAASDILEYGVMKPEACHGYSIEEIEIFSKADEDPEKGREIVKDGVSFILNRDPTGRRVGECVIANVAVPVADAIKAARKLTCKDHLEKHPLLESQILNATKQIGDALYRAYPVGLPLWEPAREILEDREDLSGTAASLEVMTLENSALWWAGKELICEKKLSDFVGNNEKTKIIVKLMKGAPAREAPMSENLRKELLQHYDSKIKEIRELDSHPAEDFENSAWAKSHVKKNIRLSLQ